MSQILLKMSWMCEVLFFCVYFFYFPNYDFIDY